jgi:hypothetical protein
MRPGGAPQAAQQVAGADVTPDGKYVVGGSHSADTLYFVCDSGNHALEHGRYTAEAVAERRELAALLREMKRLVEQVDDDV